MRNVIGVVVGVVLAWLLAIVLQAFSNYFFAPAALDPSDPKQAGQIMSLMPTAGLISMLLIFFVSTLAGAFTAARVAGARWAAWAAGGLMLLIATYLAMRAQYPGWLVAATLVMIGLAAWFAGVMAGDRGSADDETDDADEPAVIYSAIDPEPDQPSGWPARGYDAPDPSWEDDPEPDPEPEPDRPRWTPLPPRNSED